MAKQLDLTHCIPVNVHNLAHDGRGVGEYQGRKVFVHGALAGESVLAQVVRKHRRFLEARTVQVEQSVMQRIAPLCQYFGECGGCQLQHLSSSEQLKHKQGVVAELLSHHAKVIPQLWADPIVSDKNDYRTKARLGVRYDRKKEQLLVGFRELRSNKITRMQDCKILDKRVGENLQALIELIQSLSIYDHIPQVEVACSDDIACIVIRHLEAFNQEDIERLRVFSSKQNYYVYLQPKGEDSIHLLAPAEKPSLKIFHPEFDVSINFEPLDFTQVNLSVNQKMLKQAIAWLQPNDSDTILDLFCGLGNFSLPFARFAHKVVGIEGAQSMVSRAHENAKANRINTTDFWAQDLFKPDWFTGIRADQFNKVILDPPRSGALEVVSSIDKVAPSQILYVSCNPITLARDAEILCQFQGYELKKVGIMDMFPHTAHIETMALFHKT